MAEDEEAGRKEKGEGRKEKGERRKEKGALSMEQGVQRMESALSSERICGNLRNLREIDIGSVEH